MDLVDALLSRATPAEGAPALTAPGLVAVLVVSAVAIGWAPAWSVLRLAVTLVHELGHAVVGVAAGRRFTGFVLRGDMSGHTVTVGRPTGAGVTAMTWAGYPAPALVGALLVWLGARGWAAPVLTVVLVGLVALLVYVRSPLTGAVVVAAGAVVGALWWLRDDGLQQHALVGAGVVLLVGAWRHVAVLVGDRSPSSDPDALARLTGLPAGVWVLSFALVCAAATWLVATEVLAVLRA